MRNDNADPDDGGASSVESGGSEPLCSFNPTAGFSLNLSTINELRWYTYLSTDSSDESQSAVTKDTQP